NPLYLGGNVFVFFGAALLLGTPIGIFLTAAHLPLVDLFIRREENNWRRTSARNGYAINGASAGGSNICTSKARVSRAVMAPARLFRVSHLGLWGWEGFRIPVSSLQPPAPPE